MNKLIMLVMLCALLKPGIAQKVIEKHIDFTQKSAISLNVQIADSIVVHTWDKKEAFIKASINVNDNKDNESYHTTFEEVEGKLMITAKFDDNEMSGRHGSFKTTIMWNVYVPTNTDVKVKTINGSVIVSGQTANLDLKTISGNVIITAKAAEIKANSISGFVDVTVSPDVKANLNFKTISGTVYSNHEIASTQHKNMVGSKISDLMNGGGNIIDLQTISGDIYFREK